MSMYEVSPPVGAGNGRGYGQPSGLGYAQVIGAILGPLVEGGAAVYGTYTQSKQSRKELRQRRAEVQTQAELQRAALEAQERQFELAQQAAIQQAQISRARAAQTAPYITAAVGFAALGLISYAALSGGKKKKKKAKR